MALPNFINNAGTSNNLKHGEIVDYIIIDIGLPKNYLDKLKSENVKIREEANSFGKEYEPKKPTYRDGGLQVTLAVLRRNVKYTEDKNTTGKNTFTYSGEDMVAPAYSIISTFIQMTPKQHYEAKSKSGWKYADMPNHRKCGFAECINGKPKIGGFWSTSESFYPAVNVVKQKISEDSREYITADNIPKGEEDIYSDLIEAEEKRKKDWANLLTEWENATEQERKDYLLNIVSSRLLLCRLGDNKRFFEYLKPGIGMIGRGCIDNPENRKYFNIIGIGDCDWKNKITEIFSTLNTELPTEENIKIVNMIKKSLGEKKKKYEKEEKDFKEKMKTALYGEGEEKEEDDPPF